MGRIDVVINVAEHRLSTGAIEEVIGHCESIAECAVIDIDDEFKGEVPVGFVVVKNNVAKKESDIVDEVIQSVRDKLGAVISFKIVIIVKKLPKTRSGKILRNTLRAIFDNKDYPIPSIIEDASVLDEIKKEVLDFKNNLKLDCKI